MSHYFYLARCADSSLYAGYTTDLARRFLAHNLGKGAKYTASHRPITLVHAEEFPTRSAALRREAEVKRWRRARKEELLMGENKE